MFLEELPKKIVFPEKANILEYMLSFPSYKINHISQSHQYQVILASSLLQYAYLFMLIGY
jgi:hypothetical protein